MGDFFNKLNDISNLLDDVSDTVNTTKHGIDAMHDSGQKITRMIQRATSEENEIARRKIEGYCRRKDKSIRRTILFCIFLIFVTVLICVFL